MSVKDPSDHTHGRSRDEQVGVTETTHTATSAEETPGQVITEMMRGFLYSRAIAVAARLDLAERLAAGPRSVDDLAAEVGADPSALGRLMLALSTKGVFRRLDPTTYANTPASNVLRLDAEGSWHDLAIVNACDGIWTAWTGLESAIRSGQTQFEARNGRGFWAYFDHEPELQRRYNRGMAAFGRLFDGSIVRCHDFSRYRTVVDVGGNVGQFLGRVLTENPEVSGAVFDRSEVAAEAGRAFACLGLGERLRFVAGDFLRGIPAGFDGYVLKFVLHNWSDAHAATILKNCRRAMPAHAELIVVDAMLDTREPNVSTAWSDLNRLITQGGADRSPEALGRLLNEAGFEAISVDYAAPGIGVLVARPFRA